MRSRTLGKNVVVIGSQWGDEGKGKIVDLLTDRAHAVARRDFIWHHGELHSGIEMFDGTRTYAQVFPILADEPR